MIRGIPVHLHRVAQVLQGETLPLSQQTTQAVFWVMMHLSQVQQEVVIIIKLENFHLVESGMMREFSHLHWELCFSNLKN